ncbi:MAG: peptidylprolyl isomerase [Chitinispirillia bacterium]|nr:peptidylprolyl isomerase [Chitinispirillia bacterium]
MNPTLKSLLTIVSVVALCVFSLSCGGKKTSADAAVIVNGETITSEQISQAAMFFRMQQLRLSPESVFEGSETELRKGAARQLIANTLMVEDIKNRGWRADSARIDRMASRFASQFGDRETFLAQLSAMGESEESMRAGMEEELLLDSLMNVISELKEAVTEEEKRAHFEENKHRYVSQPRVRASHIVFTIDLSSDSAEVWEVMSRAHVVQARAKAGEDFDALIKKYSAQPNHGDMGWFRTGELVPDLEQALFTLKKGEISTLVPSSMGIHILKKTDEEEQRSLAYEEAADRVRQNVEMSKRGELVNSYIDSLIAAANIRYIDASLIPND